MAYFVLCGLKIFDDCVQKVCKINAKPVKTAAHGVTALVSTTKATTDRRKEQNASGITIYLFS